LVRRYRDGDDQSATALYQRYARRLRVLARARCGRTFSSRFDPDDVVQAAFRVLFLKLRELRTCDSASLWSLLVSLAFNKARGFAEHHSAAKRSAVRTQSADNGDRPFSVEDPRAAGAFDIVAIREQVERLPEDDRRVVQLRLDGYEVTEIVQSTGRPQRTVERVLKMFREQVTAT
jgi:RNA polymerase sigma-70 factor (ECF subfamily)